jgi:hypothetical protein
MAFIWDRNIVRLLQLLGDEYAPKIALSTPFPHRNRWEQIDTEISVHSEGLMLPKIKQQRPNEDESSMNFRVVSYEPITKSIWAEALGKVQSILSSTRLDFPAGEATKEYIQNPNFNSNTLFDWFTQEYTKNVINDPNGLTVVYPIGYRKKSPVLNVCQSEVLYVDDRAVVFLSLEESDYTVTLPANRAYVKQRESRLFTKYVYHVFTRDRFLSVESTNTKDLEVVTDLSFDLPFIPAFQNGGIMEMEYIYKSYFDRAIPFGNLALDRHSDNTAVNANFSYPHVSADAEDCRECLGHGKIYDDDSGDDVLCEKCHGSGKTVVFSPNKIILRRQVGNDPTELQANRPPIEFHHANVSILDYSTRTWEQYLEKFKEALCIYSRRGTGGAESAQSIELQLTPMLTFLNEVSVGLYAGMEKVVQAIEGYLGGDPAAVVITRPASFQIQSESSALSIVGQMLSSDTSPILRREKLHSFLSKFVGRNSTILKMVKVLERADRLFYFSMAEKLALLDKGVATPDEISKSIDIQHRILNSEVLLMESVDDAVKEILETAQAA